MLRFHHRIMRLTGTAAALVLLLSACDPGRKQRALFFEALQTEFHLAAKRLDSEEAGVVADEYRKRMDVHLKELDNPAAVWDEYHRTLIVIRFYEAVQRECGMDKEERNTNLEDISMAAVTLGYGALDSCRRLYLFAALYRAVALERTAALPDAYVMDPTVHGRIKGAAEDPDCLIKAGYLFLTADEKMTLGRARKLLGSAKTFHCGLPFLNFIEPGDVDVPLVGVRTLVEADIERSDRRKFLEMIVEHLAPLIRQEGDAVVKNLEVSYKTKLETGRLALLLLSAVEEPWNGTFWEETALFSPVPEDRVLALRALARQGDEGLPHFRRILEFKGSGPEDKVLTETFLREMANLFIASWKAFSPKALEQEKVIELLAAAAGDRAALANKAAFLKTLHDWQSVEPSEDEKAGAFSDAVAAMEPDLRLCWHRAKLKGLDAAAGLMNVSARLGEDGRVRDVSTEDTELPSEGLKACVREVFMMLSFPDDVFEEDEVVSVQLRYPLGPDAAPRPAEEAAAPDSEPSDGEAPEEAAGNEQEKVPRQVPKKPLVGKVVVGGGKGVGIGDVKKGLEAQTGYMSICAGAALEKSNQFKPGAFVLRFFIKPDGRPTGIKIEGEGVTDYFAACVKRGLVKTVIKAPESGKVWAKVEMSFPPGDG